MKLRPHHLLCIQKYTGHGYNAAFTAHMNRLTAALTAETEIRIVSGTDDICTACPNRCADRCRSEEKVRRMDLAAAACCGITADTVQQWQQLAQTAYVRVFCTDAFARICADCEWYTLCCEKEL